MSVININVVAGLAGCGKTTWIYQQIQNLSASVNVIYFSPGTGKVPIDQTRLAADFPHIKVFHDGQETEFLQQLAKFETAYIELGFYLELTSVKTILNGLSYQSLAILPPTLQQSEYHAWADKIIPGADIDTNILSNQLWRVPSNGQVIDEDSLQEFWYEITHGAYGQVSRAKGVFDVADGRSLYADFVAGVPATEFLELDLPRHLAGRPERFSGLEVLGNNLDESAMKQTLEDCYLSEVAITQYQQQVKQILLEENIE
ncbi:GTP-binding protein [Aliinostoc sp. HNIBRCY26]|uniref:GTP-binding protein n=1 Tax=Aliinostoc sp. HNIBRCY26 TaxID=3418997 RepID=UPI003D0674EC